MIRSIQTVVMTDVAVFSGTHPSGEQISGEISEIPLTTPDGSLTVKWAPEAATSTLGLISFFCGVSSHDWFLAVVSRALSRATDEPQCTQQYHRYR